MKLQNTLGSLLFASLLALPSVGCVVRGTGRVHVGAPIAVVEIEEEPPPPRVVVMDVRPGFLFIDGRWDRRGRNWVWVDGHYERERMGHRWEAGRWERRGRGHVWVEGRWQSGGHVEQRGPAVRDHRDNPPPPPPGPVVRDHR